MNPLETIRKEQTPFTRATECGGAHQRRTKGCRWTAFTVLFTLLALPCSSFAQSALRGDADAQNRHTPNLNLSARAAALDRQQRQPNDFGPHLPPGAGRVRPGEGTLSEDRPWLRSG